MLRENLFRGWKIETRMVVHRMALRIDHLARHSPASHTLVYAAARAWATDRMMLEGAVEGWLRAVYWSPHAPGTETDGDDSTGSQEYYADLEAAQDAEDYWARMRERWWPACSLDKAVL